MNNDDLTIYSFTLDTINISCAVDFKTIYKCHGGRTADITLVILQSTFTFLSNHWRLPSKYYSIANAKMDAYSLIVIQINVTLFLSTQIVLLGYTNRFM